MWLMEQPLVAAIQTAAKRGGDGGGLGDSEKEQQEKSLGMIHVS